jgi:hypothetical protein
MSHWEKAFFLLFILMAYWDNRDMRKRIQKLEVIIDTEEKDNGKIR